MASWTYGFTFEKVGAFLEEFNDCEDPEIAGNASVGAALVFIPLLAWLIVLLPVYGVEKIAKRFKDKKNDKTSLGK